MKKIKFNQDLNLWYELADTLGDTLWLEDKLWNKLKNELELELNWNLKQPIRRISSY